MYRTLANLLLLLVFVVADRWIESLDTTWSETASQLLFGALFVFGIALNWRMNFGAQRSDDEKGRLSVEGHRAFVRHWRTSFLAAILGILAVPAIVILAGRSLGAAWIANVGVPMAVLVVLTVYAASYRPTSNVVPAYSFGALFLCFLGYLIWQLIQLVLVDEGSASVDAYTEGAVPLGFLVFPVGLFVVRAISAMRIRKTGIT